MPSATDKLNEIDGNVDAIRYFVKLDITKYGVKNDGWALAWPRYDTLQNSLNPTNQSYIQYLEEQARKYRDDKNKFLKYHNTINFYNDVRETANRM